ncbi:unnamed protein product [Meganyctiphanes norvegica]|uniref:MD-2-related lipid-recognition domain-containing protein n=1 Tax=Meganyctiphanes norvegica TaxID=48144 RepID=A0AAV2QEU2_MEGNR
MYPFMYHHYRACKNQINEFYYFTEVISMHTLTVFCIAITAAAATPFEDCGSLAADSQLKVPDCDIPPCIVSRGTQLLADMVFTPSVDSSTLETQVYGDLLGMQVPWPGMDTNGCHQLEAAGDSCPLVAGERTSWHLEMDILNEYPAVSTVATFQLIDADGGFQVCAKVPVQVV